MAAMGLRFKTLPDPSDPPRPRRAHPPKRRPDPPATAGGPFAFRLDEAASSPAASPPQSPRASSPRRISVADKQTASSAAKSIRPASPTTRRAQVAASPGKLGALSPVGSPSASPGRERADTERTRRAKALQEQMFARFDAERATGGGRGATTIPIVEDQNTIEETRSLVPGGGSYESWRAMHDWRRREDRRSAEEAEEEVRSLVGARVYDLGKASSIANDHRDEGPGRNETEAASSPDDSPRRSVAAAAAAGANLLRGVNELFPTMGRTKTPGGENEAPSSSGRERVAKSPPVGEESTAAAGAASHPAPDSDAAAVASLARRVADLESLLADRDVQLAQLEDERWRQDEQNAKLDLDIDAAKDEDEASGMFEFRNTTRRRKGDLFEGNQPTCIFSIRILKKIFRIF